MNNHGDAGDYDIVDVRMALQEAGALLPERTETEQMWKGEEDLRGVEEFIQWFSGTRMKEMMEMGSGDTESDATDYLAGKKNKQTMTDIKLKIGIAFPQSVLRFRRLANTPCLP